MTVRIRNIYGHLRVVELTDNGKFATPGSALEQQLVTTAKNAVLIRKFVARSAGSSNPHLYDLLDNEIRAGTRMGQVFGRSCPPELPELVGYDMDAEEPFALLRSYKSAPLVNDLNRLGDKERRRLQVSLVRALQLTGTAGVVHGNVNLRHLRWNGDHVQLVDFESARLVELPGRSNVAGPPQVDVREDLASAGMIIRQLAMGPSAAASLADHGRDPDYLRAVLDGVFLPAGQRPYAADLLRRMRADTVLPETSDPEAGLAEGRRLFDEVVAQRNGTPAPPGPRRWRRPGRWLGLLLLTTLVIATIAEGTLR